MTKDYYREESNNCVICFYKGDKIKNYFRNSLYYLDKTSNFAKCLGTCCSEFYF